MVHKKKLSEHHKEAQALLKAAITRSETIFLTSKQTLLGHPQWQLSGARKTVCVITEHQRNENRALKTKA